MLHSTPRALIMHPFQWLGLPRLPQILVEGGFAVASLCLPDALLTKTRFNERVFELDDRDWVQAMRSLTGAYAQWPFDILLPGDDTTLKMLQDAYLQMTRGNVTGLPTGFKDVLKRSLGDPSGFAAVQSKAAIGEALMQAGVPVPKRARVDVLADALAFAEEHGYPVLLKREASSSGSGVRTCNNEEELANAGFELMPTFRKDRSLVVFVEQYVVGRRYGIPFVAWDRQVVGTGPHEKTQTNPPVTGVTTVMTSVDDQRLTSFVKSVIDVTGFQGLGSVEAMIDEDGKPWFLELNARFTPPMSPSRKAGLHVGKLLFAAVTAKTPDKVNWTPGVKVALFPQEWMRVPGSPNLHDSIHDLVVDDPELESAYRGLIDETLSRSGGR